MKENFVFDEPWKVDAECLDADPDIFFPIAGSNAMDARAVCAKCKVREECLNYAMVNRLDEGIWGGTSAVQREMLRGSRRKRYANVNAG